MRTLTFALLLSVTGLVTAGDADYTERMATEHAGEKPSATGAARTAPAAAVSGRNVPYATVNGAAIEGYLAVPAEAAGPGPAVIVIHEWWGLNDNMRAMADRLAGEGYAALAVDLYGGMAADDAGGARELMQKAMGDPDALRDNLRQAYAYLDTELQATRIGSIGWCFGGGWSLQTALMFPGELDAAVIYYGRLETDPAVLEPLDLPILGLFGGQDRGIPVATVREFEDVLDSLDKDATILVYDDADHAFANPSGQRYNPEAAADAWARTTNFLAQHLKP